MKKYIYILIAILLLSVSCSREVKSRIRVIKTGEKAFVTVEPKLYQKGDTVIVYYSEARGFWRIDENWIKFKDQIEITSFGLYYKAVIE